MIQAKFAEVLDSTWTAVQPIVLGRVPTRGPEPTRYVLVEGGASRLRCDIYLGEPQARTFEDVQVWGDLVVVGFGERVHCVDLRSRAVTTHICDFYFGHLYADRDYCLIASGWNLMRLNGDGTLLWKSPQLGLDGVIVTSVEGGAVHGEGEWDPPDGWRPFKISLATGATVAA